MLSFDFELFSADAYDYKWVNFEFCNRLCRLPEQEWSALPMLNCSMLNYYLSSIIESLKCLLMMGLQVFNNFKIGGNSFKDTYA